MSIQKSSKIVNSLLHTRRAILNLKSSVVLNKYSVLRNQLPFKYSQQSSNSFHTSSNLLHGEYERQPPKSDDEIVNVTLFDRDNIEFKIKGKVGDNLMMLAQVNDVDIEGACEASLACCTCHVYVQDEYFDKLEEADLKEEDLLDMAPFLAENSRLSCQIILRKDLDGMTVRLPMGTRNMRVDQK